MKRAIDWFCPTNSSAAIGSPSGGSSPKRFSKSGTSILEDNWSTGTIADERDRGQSPLPTTTTEEVSSDIDTCTIDTSTDSPSSSSSLPQPPTPRSTHNLNINNYHHLDRYQSTMPSTEPIDIATPTSRNASSSPSSQGQPIPKNPNHNHIHNTSSKFLDTADPDSRTSAMMSHFDSSMKGRQDSFAGAKPISMNNPNRGADGRPRRESMAGSLVGGMSWGGVSVGSWIRDDIIMAGTSPFPMQSPSYHSSSYLPKLEANFMRDFACCGQTLPTLHDLLQHYEESHAQQTPQSLRTMSAAQRARENSTPNSKAALAAQVASSVQQQAQQQSQPGRSGLQIPQGGAVGGIQQLRQQQLSQPSTPIQKNVQPILDEMDGMDDMEMDDPVGIMDQAPETPVQQTQQPVQAAQQSLFGQQPRPQLNLNLGGMSGLRTSQPPTPASAGFGFQQHQGNPTVSSVNTPTLSTHMQQQQNAFSPNSSVPGTPAGDFEDDFSNMALNMGMNGMNGMNMAYPFGFGNNDMGVDLCIDDPAKRLFSPNGGYNNQNQRALQQQFAQFNIGNGQYGNNTALMQAYQQQRIAMSGMMDNTMMGEEHKPFKCPVIGCEKAYKNQNGLKYHKTHGHQTQQLHENGDGTFSIVNPETSTPYPGTLGMEKEKPYKCEVCGKRYKNLNGLKYHKQHSPPCNPDLKLSSHMVAAGLGGLGVNVAGLPGIGEEGMM